MTLHDWEKVTVEIYNHFHQVWSTAICRARNNGILPERYDALVEQRKGPREGDALAIDLFSELPRPALESGGVLTSARPQARIVREAESGHYANNANTLVVQHHLGPLVAMIEIVSPGDKDRRTAVSDFVQKAREAIEEGVHLLILDPFPPGSFGPLGMHKCIWDKIGEVEEFSFPSGQDRLAMAYEAGEIKRAYVETIAVGDAWPVMPLFLKTGRHVKDAVWADTPKSVRSLLR